MPLNDAVAGALRGGQLVTTVQADGTPYDFTGLSQITGKLKNLTTKATRTIQGTLTPTANPLDGQFQWDYDPADVPLTEIAVHEAQFQFAYSSGATPASHFVDTFNIRKSL